MTTRTPAEAFPPGEFLREELEARGWTQTDLAAILGRPIRTVNEIIKGKSGITPETAKGLSAALGTSPEYWLNLESSYQLWRVRADADDTVARRARLYSLAPIKDMVRRGWLERSDSVDLLELQVLDFFEITSIDEEPDFIRHAARKAMPYDAATSISLRAWLFRARKMARAVTVEAFSNEGLNAALQRLRLLFQAPQEIRHVPRILSEAGIRMVILEPLPGTRIDGACFWIGDSSPVVVLSLRYDRIDAFWFTPMHELGHVYHHDVGVDVDLDKSTMDSDRPESERRADLFASENLVPAEKLEKFVAVVRPYDSRRRVEAFSATAAVHPGIVVGQLRHRGEIAWANFRSMLVPVREWLVGSGLTDGWGASVPPNL